MLTLVRPEPGIIWKETRLMLVPAPDLPLVRPPAVETFDPFHRWRKKSARLCSIVDDDVRLQYPWISSILYLVRNKLCAFCCGCFSFVFSTEKPFPLMLHERIAFIEARRWKYFCGYDYCSLPVWILFMNNLGGFWFTAVPGLAAYAIFFVEPGDALFWRNWYLGTSLLC